jgi:hypothetical protein
VAKAKRDEKLTREQLDALVRAESAQMALGPFLPGTAFDGVPVGDRTPTYKDIAIEPVEIEGPKWKAPHAD